MAKEISPWEQQEGEPNHWFQRFTAFRLQGMGRSIEETWRRETKQSEAKRPSSRWYEIVVSWHWNDRATAWDQCLSDEKEAAFIANHMGKNEVLDRLADMARGDIADLMDITTAGYTFRLLEKNENGEHVVNPNTKLIKKIKQKVTTIIPRNKDGEEREIVENEIELYSAQDALRDIGKYHALFVERSEITGKGGSPIELNNNLNDSERAARIAAILETAKKRNESSGS